ncbi:MAG: hypothetical protein LBQ79_12840 [Deltaproteobacteria bacterium]|jgi:hypothetical protein|nr:hypothetical protein [Deltaproteobacteria bacterium]
MRSAVFAILLACGMTAVALVSNASAEDPFPNPGVKIQVWNYGFIPVTRRLSEFRLNAQFMHFNETSKVSEFTIYTNIGKFVFEGDFDHYENTLGTSVLRFGLPLSDGQFFIIKATGVMDGTLYDFTANIQPSEPPGLPQRTGLYDPNEKRDFPCVAGTSDVQVFHAVYAGREELYLKLSLNLGDEVKVFFPLSFEYLGFDGKEGDMVVATVSLTHTANPLGWCGTSAELVAMIAFPKW